MVSRTRKSLFGRRARWLTPAAIVAVAAVVIGACGPPPPNPPNPPAISSVNDYSTPGGDPWGTAFDSSGRVWVALPGCDGNNCTTSNAPGKLGLFDPTSHTWVTTVTLPSGYGQPLFVAVDSGGKVWFTMPATNAIGVYNPSTTSSSQWAVPTASSGPWGLTIDHNGKVWFTEHYVNKIASFDPTSTTFHEVPTPASNSNPYGITVDASNNIWFTQNVDAVAAVDEYTTGGVLNVYPVRTGNTSGSMLTPHLLTFDPWGNLWWSEGWVHSVGTLNIANAKPGTNNGVTEYQYTPPNSGGTHTSGIAADSQGLIWITDSLQNVFAAVPVTGSGVFTFFNAPHSHPHDGMNVDSQNRVWFDEEFGNALAEAIQSSTTTTSSSSSTTSSSTTTSTGPSGTLGSDTFHRANQSLWGTASDGQVWGGDANAATAFSIANNAGLVTNTGGTSYSAVLGSSAANEEVRLTGSLSAFSNANFGGVLRWSDGNDWYKAYIDGANLVLQKKVAGTTTVLATTPFAATGNTAYTIDFEAIGTTLQASVWAATGTQPASWMATATDGSFTSGLAGLRFLTQGATATITSFQATSH
ncbi:MAG: hypothetical protein JOZ99_01045 [Actinobacteria bacterium]|nr:hypothetical protein [Actinomycetota bacterium]